MSNWNPSLKYLPAFYLLTKLAGIFCGVKGGAKAVGNFLRSLPSRNARKRLKTEKVRILGQTLLGDYQVPPKCPDIAEESKKSLYFDYCMQKKC